MYPPHPTLFPPPHPPVATLCCDYLLSPTIVLCPAPQALRGEDQRRRTDIQVRAGKCRVMLLARTGGQGEPGGGNLSEGESRMGGGLFENNRRTLLECVFEHADW